MQNPIRRFLEWRRELLTPEYVEKASRRERWKRGAWAVASTMLTLGLVVGVGGVVAVQHLGAELGLIVTLLVWVYIDLRVFGWGLQYWDLTPPWQFRDIPPEDGTEGN